MQRNFDYIESMLDRKAELSLAELAVLFEDAIDMHDRHWKIHWMLNFAQLSATLNLRAVMEKTHGAVDEVLLGRLQNSADDRNWDKIRALWEMKEEIKGDAELQQAFVDFANKVPFYGSVVACADDPHLAAVLPRVTRRLVTYGFDDAAGPLRGTGASVMEHLAGSAVALGSFGARCSVRRQRDDAVDHLGVLELAVPGRHNLQNAMAAVAVALQIGVRFDQAAEALAGFEGAERRFERHGDDLVFDLPVSFSQAALGAQVTIPTVYGEEEIRVPPGTQPETVLRLKGRGLPVLGQGSKGDLLIRVRVWTPERLTDEQEGLFRQLATLEGDPPKRSPGFWSKLKEALGA